MSLSVDRSIPEVETVYYYSHDTKSVVKLKADMLKTKTDGHIPDHIEMELIKYGHKEPVVQAPVYEEGDWWVFQVKSAATWKPILIPNGEYKVTYKDGKFESDDPKFLQRNLDSPFVSVDLNDPQTKDFEFPLTPGKKWSFRFPALGIFSGQSRWRLVDAEIVRRAPQPLETRAGRFKVIEIRRTDQGFRLAQLNLTYFYSPETKSVVRLTAELFGDQGRPVGHYEMELIKYGRGATISEQPVVKAPVIK